MNKKNLLVALSLVGIVYFSYNFYSIEKILLFSAPSYNLPNNIFHHLSASRATTTPRTALGIASSTDISASAINADMSEVDSEMNSLNTDISSASQDMASSSTN